MLFGQFSPTLGPLTGTGISELSIGFKLNNSVSILEAGSCFEIMYQVIKYKAEQLSTVTESVYKVEQFSIVIESVVDPETLMYRSE